MRWLCLLVAVMISGPAWGAPVRAISGDTLALDGTTVRLFAIEAMHPTDACWVPQGRWSCGEFARSALHDLVFGREVTCVPVDSGLFAEARVARCSVNGRDLGATMVRGGWAFARRTQAPEYGALEDRARTLRAGLWRGEAGAALGFGQR